MKTPLPPDCRLIPGFPDYCVSSCGVVYSRFVYGSRQRRVGPWWALKLKPSHGGRYWCVNLYRVVGKSERRLVHSLVLSAFVGPPPKGQEGRHSNDVGTDNRLENLSYGTKLDNFKDSVRNGLARLNEGHHNAIWTNEQIREVRRLCAEGKGDAEVGLPIGMSAGYVSRIRRRQIWKYLD